ncbi:hypothetical protein H072_11476 [Dactylellina haptotyla CBS 200.50]|uniref:NADP-dependent oxidoreductase domain-containing protein n=1 Tax=Dactylellina haptotyla (strain CBS 200.50) TaxID=1284197 RepID=S7ZWH5_DACHA|nr:hypothetical protein H072_11476 [Dactylellina haptotyla CBS 200.50]
MPSKYSVQDRVPLPGSNATMPRIGYGVYRSADCKKAVSNALLAGYRHIDTAQFYRNEAAVGEAIKEAGIPREDIYIVTKIQYPVENSIEKTLESIRESVKRIDPDDENRKGYVDLFLVHTPTSGRSGREILWAALELLKQEGEPLILGSTTSKYDPPSPSPAPTFHFTFMGPILANTNLL